MAMTQREMEYLDRCAVVFQAMGDLTRQRILALLEEHDRCVNELVSHFRLSQPTISKHLSVLRQANLVIDTREGRRVCYSLDREFLARHAACFYGRFACCREMTIAGPSVGLPAEDPLEYHMNREEVTAK